MDFSGQLSVPVVLPWEKNPSSHRTGGWAGSSFVLEILEKKKFFFSTQIRTMGNPARSLVTVPTELSRFLQHSSLQIKLC
jgi:hypothetical protein